MEYRIVRNYRDNIFLRRSFDELAAETFGLSFEDWYQNGYWKEKFNPWSIVVNGIVVSNISVNQMEGELYGDRRHYIQLGTVMTKKEYRHKGYNRLLLEMILKEYEQCDGIFLFANDSVLDYYPRFGFEPMTEYRYYTEIEKSSAAHIVSVSMKTGEDWNRFLAEKARMVSNGNLCFKNDELLMFYLTKFMQENVFYHQEMDAYIIAEQEGDTLTVYDVFSPEPVDVKKLCSSFGAAVRRAEFAFVLLSTEGLSKCEHKEKDTTLFVLGAGIKEDMKHIGSIPELAHT